MVGDLRELGAWKEGIKLNWTKVGVLGDCTRVIIGWARWNLEEKSGASIST